MTSERDPSTTDAGIEDLDADDADADNVTGGRIGDPCDGGE